MWFRFLGLGPNRIMQGEAIQQFLYKSMTPMLINKRHIRQANSRSAGQNFPLLMEPERKFH